MEEAGRVHGAAIQLHAGPESLHRAELANRGDDGFDGAIAGFEFETCADRQVAARRGPARSIRSTSVLWKKWSTQFTIRSVRRLSQRAPVSDRKTSHKAIPATKRTTMPRAAAARAASGGCVVTASSATATIGRLSLAAKFQMPVITTAVEMSRSVKPKDENIL